ncbi:MAG: DNA cytosine methyltransferase [Ktedonobacteraceae bacterium]
MQFIEARQPPPIQKPNTQKVLTSLELFAGAGGLALGTHAAGFKHLGLVEWDAFAVKTLRGNSRRVLNVHPDSVFHCDARTVAYKQFAGQVDLLSGGPPCQPFSNGGQSRGPEDTRDMFPVFLDTVAEIMPHAILIENVRGLLRENFRVYFRYILKRLQFPLCAKEENATWQNHYKRLLTLTEKDFADEEQYRVAYQLINTADYGIPQIRERVIITAFRRDLGIDTFQLKATHSKEALFMDQWVTGRYWTQRNTSSYDYLSLTDKEIVEKLRNQLFPVEDRLPWLTIRDVIHDLPTPVKRGDREEIPNHIQHPGARVYPGHTGSILDYPAKALKSGVHGTPGGENVLCIPPEGVIRYLTAREAARLQTFPDEWYFHGSWGACMKQLGNAVPAELIRLFSKEIRQRLANVLV